MELWQLDVTASAFLADGAEVKIVTGVDDHSRFCVIAKAVMRATARPVCRAFVEAMRIYGMPEEVLTDNGKVFTGRFHKPGVPAEVLFERICRENGITHRLTKIQSPTTTGKIERLHQSLQRELLDVHGPFESIAGAAGRAGCLAAGVQHRPAAPVAGHGLPRLPVHPGGLAAGAADAGPAHGEHAASRSTPPAPGPLPAPSCPRRQLPRGAMPEALASRGGGRPGGPASGNLQLGGQQVWLGPALAGRKVTIWVDEISLHVLLDGARIKTLPSRLGVTELARLAASGARPAGPSPLPAGTGAVIEVDRTVNATGLVSLADQQVSVG